MTNWIARGPFAIFGQEFSANLPAQGNPVAGAVNTVVVKPGDPNTLYVATDGGGVWVTHNALIQNMNGIHWEPLTDSGPSLVITALAIDPLDASGNTLYAATAGPRRALLKTTDGGRIWFDQSGGIFNNQNVARIVPTTITETTGAVVLVAGAKGVYRSADGAISWALMLAGNVTSLAADPGNPSRFYAGLPGQGVFRSDPDPATAEVGRIWSPANGNIDALRAGARMNSDTVRLSVHHNTETGSHVLYAVLNVGNAHNVFFSTNQGQAWTLMDNFPDNGENSSGRGINEIVADRLSPNVVYIGGVAGVYQGDRTRVAGQQWAHLAGTTGQSPLPGSANGTGEHGDSRWLTFDTQQNLLEGNDGGIYRLIHPNDPATRIWQSLNGDLNATQFYSVAFDSLNNMLIGGNQDNGVVGQIPGGTAHLWSAEEDLGDTLSSTVPAWSNEEDLGGVLTSSPGCVSWGFNRIDVFYEGQNSHLWHRSWDGAQWNAEEDLGGVLTSRPAAASWGFNRIDVFYRGQNNHLWHRSWDGAQWNNEEDLGGVLFSAPAAVSWEFNRIDVFYEGQNSHLWHRSWDGAQWNNEEDLGGVLSSAPAAVSWGSGRIDVFYSSVLNGHLRHRSWNGEEDLGGLLSSAPGASSWGPTRLDIFYSGQNRHLWHRSWDQGHWNAEEDLGGYLTSNPVCVSWGFDRIDVFYRGQNNHLWHRSWDGAQWNAEEDLGGGVLTSSPAAVSWGFNRIDVFYRGQNSHLWHRSWDGAQWNAEEDLGGVLSSSPAVASWSPNRLDIFFRDLNQALRRLTWDGAQWLGEEQVGGVLSSAPAAISSGPNRVDVFYSSQNFHLWHRANLGVPPQSATSWSQMLAGDGMTVQVETTSEPNVAHQYFSGPHLDYFTRRRLNLATGVDTSSGIALFVQGTNSQRLSQVDNTISSVQPYVLNQIDPTRLLLGTTFLYESFDRGDTLISLGGVVALDGSRFAPQQPVGLVNPNVGYAAYNPMIYGGRSGEVDNADLIWVGAGGNLYLRTGGRGMPKQVNTYTAVGGLTVFAIAVDPSDWQKAFVMDANGNIWRTTDAGRTNANWTNLRRNIGNLTSDLQDLVFFMSGRDEVLLVSAQDGVYVMINPGPATVWNRFGNGLPYVMVTDLRYYRTSDLLVAGTYGRGAWVATNASRL
jgi:hypothetical protein